MLHASLAFGVGSLMRRRLRRLRRLHRTHHDPKVIAHANITLNYPICNWLFGTLKAG